MNCFVSTRLESEENSKTSCNVRNFGEENSKGELNKRREMRCVGISNERERERDRIEISQDKGGGTKRGMCF